MGQGQPVSRTQTFDGIIPIGSMGESAASASGDVGRFGFVAASDPLTGAPVPSRVASGTLDPRCIAIDEMGIDDGIVEDRFASFQLVEERHQTPEVGPTDRTTKFTDSGGNAGALSSALVNVAVQNDRFAPATPVYSQELGRSDGLVMILNRVGGVGALVDEFGQPEQPFQAVLAAAAGGGALGGLVPAGPLGVGLGAAIPQGVRGAPGGGATGTGGTGSGGATGGAGGRRRSGGGPRLLGGVGRGGFQFVDPQGQSPFRFFGIQGRGALFQFQDAETGGSPFGNTFGFGSPLVRGFDFVTPRGGDPFQVFTPEGDPFFTFGINPVARRVRDTPAFQRELALLQNQLKNATGTDAAEIRQKIRNLQREGARRRVSGAEGQIRELRRQLARATGQAAERLRERIKALQALPAQREVSGFEFVPQDPRDIRVETHFGLGQGRVLGAGVSALPPGVNINDVAGITVVGGTTVVRFKDGREVDLGRQASQANFPTDNLGNPFDPRQFDPKLIQSIAPFGRGLGLNDPRNPKNTDADTSRGEELDLAGGCSSPCEAPDQDFPSGYVWGAGVVRENGDETTGGTTVRSAPTSSSRTLPDRGPPRIGLWSSIVFPEAAKGQWFEAGDATPIGPLPIRCDAQFAIGPVDPDDGAAFVGPLRIVDVDAANLPFIGTPIKGELWKDTSLKGLGASQPGEDGKIVPVIRVHGRIPPRTPPPETDGVVIKGKTKKKKKEEEEEEEEQECDNRRSPTGVNRPIFELDLDPFNGAPFGRGTAGSKFVRGGLEEVGRGIAAGAGGNLGPYGTPCGPRGGTKGGSSGDPDDTLRDPKDKTEERKKKNMGGTRARTAQDFMFNHEGRDYSPAERVDGPQTGMVDRFGRRQLGPDEVGDAVSPATTRPRGWQPVERTGNQVLRIRGVGGSFAPDDMFEVPTTGAGTILTRENGFNLATFPVHVFGQAGGPLYLEDSIRLSQLQQESARQQWVAFAGGERSLEASTSAWATNRHGLYPAPHSYGHHIGAEKGSPRIRRRGNVFEVYSVVDNPAGTRVSLSGDGVMSLRREHRGMGPIDDSRPLLLLQNSVGKGDSDGQGDMISSADCKYRVDSDGALYTPCATMPDSDALAVELPTDGVKYYSFAGTPYAATPSGNVQLGFDSDTIVTTDVEVENPGTDSQSVQTTAAGNSGGGETDLMAYTVPAETVELGDQIKVEASGSFGGGGGSRDLRFVVNGTTIGTFNVGASGNNDNWTAKGVITRTELTNTAKVSITVLANGEPVFVTQNTGLSINWGSAFEVKFTGQDSTATDDEVVQDEMDVIHYKLAPGTTNFSTVVTSGGNVVVA